MCQWIGLSHLKTGIFIGFPMNYRGFSWVSGSQFFPPIGVHRKNHEDNYLNKDLAAQLMVAELKKSLGIHERNGGFYRWGNPLEMGHIIGNTLQ
jgi:hypothetical protein